MTVTVADGSNYATANSYLSVADADAYHALRVNEAWGEATTPEKEAALIRATQGIDVKYKSQWIGVKAHSGQLLAWPRAKVIDTDQTIETVEGETIAITAIPQPLKDACAEVALIELTTRFVQREITRTSMIKRQKVDVIETEYMNGAPTGTVYPFIDQLLEGLASSALNSISFNIGVTASEQAALDAQESGELEYLSDSRYFTQG